MKRISSNLYNVVQKSGKKYKKKEESTEIRKKVQEFEPCFIQAISFRCFMESINYYELKREAYLMAIEKLEEEYSDDKEVLKKLEDYKIKNLNGELVQQ